MSAAKASKTPRNDAESRRVAAYYQKHKTRLQTAAKARYNTADEYSKAVRRFRNAANPSMPKPGSVRYQDPRNIALAQAFCQWSDVDEVVRIYVACGVMNELGFENYVVDHTIPLVNPLVCGLHVHHNMSVITRRENSIKGNYIWPQMPELTWGTIDMLLASF